MPVIHGPFGPVFLVNVSYSEGSNYVSQTAGRVVVS